MEYMKAIKRKRINLHMAKMKTLIDLSEIKIDKRLYRFLTAPDKTIKSKKINANSTKAIKLLVDKQFKAIGNRYMTVFEVDERFNTIYNLRLKLGLEDNTLHEKKAVTELPRVERGMFSNAQQCDSKMLGRI